MISQLVTSQSHINDDAMGMPLVFGMLSGMTHADCYCLQYSGLTGWVRTYSAVYVASNGVMRGQWFIVIVLLIAGGVSESAPIHLALDQ